MFALAQVCSSVSTMLSYTELYVLAWPACCAELPFAHGAVGNLCLRPIYNAATHHQ
jgi:hypothetical protein